jgi:tryptophan-rich sensory protein
MKKIINYSLVLLFFLLVNFSGLALGSLWTDPGVNSEWYQNIIKAPWTPPGFVFGLSWTIIMICFSIFMTNLYERNDGSYNPIILFSWFLNIIWNPLFFYLHWTWISAGVIILLTLVIGFLIHENRKQYKYLWLLLLPYFIWLNIATSLNLFTALVN